MEKYRRNTRQLASGLPNCIDARTWPTRRTAQRAIGAWIAAFSNRQRSRSALAYRSPVACEQALAKEGQAAATCLLRESDEGQYAMH